MELYISQMNLIYLNKNLKAMSNQLNIFEQANLRAYKKRYNFFYKGVKERAIKRREQFENSKYDDISILINSKNI